MYIKVNGRVISDIETMTKIIGAIEMATPEDEVSAIEEIIEMARSSKKNVEKTITVTTPDPVEELIMMDESNSENETVNEESETVNKENETVNEEIKAMKIEVTGVENGEQILRGAILTIQIHDLGMSADNVMMDRFICSLANDAQFNRVSSRLLVDDIMAQARNRMDPSLHDHAQLDEDGRLPGLTDAQLELIETCEDRVDMANVLIADCARWHEEFGDGRNMLRRSDEEVRRTLIEARERKARAGVEMSKQRREFLKKARTQRVSQFI